jgi:recombination protein RecA
MSFSPYPDVTAGGHVAFTQKWPEPICEQLRENPKLAEVMPASRLEVRPAPEMVSSGIRALDDLTGGLPRGCLSEICGVASSGRTSVMLTTLAAATGRQETCALVDVSDAFDPVSAANAGVQFERLLWVRCGAEKQNSHSPQRHRNTETGNRKIQTVAHSIDQALRISDLILQSKGFGLVAIDLGDVAGRLARRIPLTSWFRFQRAVEHTPTVLFVITPAPCAQTCAALLVRLKEQSLAPSLCSGQAKNARSPFAEETATFDDPVSKTHLLRKTQLTHTQLLDGLQVEGELLRSRTLRKPVQSVTTAFTTRALRNG